ncbi:MAG: nucleotidyl transferase AbiEii/AbiGii toxin family protein [Acidimicrobiales bacterium]
MIPAQVVTAWRATHPWATDRQVEQDLILSRLAVEIGQHPELRDRLVWRGGTCLHKIVLPAPLRYSEDLDYVAFGIGGTDFGPILSALRDVAGGIGLEVARTRATSRKLEIRLRFDPSGGGASSNIKVEVNIDEVDSLFALDRRTVVIDTEWWAGQSDVLVFDPTEMIGTKFRALAQRSKGRDLNDLELAHLELALDDGQLAACAAHYLHHERIGANEFKARLFNHLDNPDFVEDVARFITKPTHLFEPARLVERWILWSDEYLDRAMIDIDIAADAPGANDRLSQWQARRDGLVQCAAWINDSGNRRRCRRRLSSGRECLMHI